MNVKEIVREAKQFTEASSDHKCWASKGEMLALIAAGAQIVRNEQEDDIGGIYVTEVTFEGIHFFHRNFQPLIPINSILH